MFGKVSTGAQNATTFRESILSSKKPLVSSCLFDGLVKEYFFSTGLEETSHLLETAYSVGIDQDPLTREKEIHLAIGLHSSEDGKNKRHDLNLVVVLDISGSMQSAMSSTDKKTKIEVSKEVLCDIIDDLKDYERIGIVLFETNASVFQPLSYVQDLDRTELKGRIMEITAKGGTNFKRGMVSGISLYSGLDNNDPNSNRLIYLTDACPNSDETITLEVLSSNANIGPYKIYSTFIGVGLDFNTKIVSALTKVRGSNYFSVKSNDEFKTILKDDFNYTVTSICFNVTVSLESDDCEIETCYGAGSGNSTDTLMKIDSCSAGQIDERGVKGGIVLVKLRSKTDSPTMNLKFALNYEDSNGKKQHQEKSISIDSSLDEFYETSGVRKAIVLSRYMNTIRKFASETGQSTINWQELYNYLDREREILKEEGLAAELVLLKKCQEIDNNIGSRLY